MMSSLHFDRRYVVLAVENGWAGHIRAQPEYEFASWRGQPVRFMTWRSRALNVDVNGTVSVRHQTGAIADAVPIERIRHKAIVRITHGQRPESIVWRKA